MLIIVLCINSWSLEGLKDHWSDRSHLHWLYRIFWPSIQTLLRHFTIDKLIKALIELADLTGSMASLSWNPEWFYQPAHAGMFNRVIFTGPLTASHFRTVHPVTVEPELVSIPESVGFILSAPRSPEPNFTVKPQTLVQMFQSGPKWCPDWHHPWSQIVGIIRKNLKFRG